MRERISSVAVLLVVAGPIIGVLQIAVIGGEVLCVCGLRVAILSCQILWISVRRVHVRWWVLVLTWIDGRIVGSASRSHADMGGSWRSGGLASPV